MFDNRIFNPRDARCKSPYGAVSSGTRVQLTLRPLRELGFSRGKVTLRYEFEHNRTETLAMPWTGTDWVHDEFSCTIPTGSYVGLLWYSFELTGLHGNTLELGEYQLTVYDDSLSVPDWFGKGLCYHIFPDRFARTAIPDPTGLPGNRTVHENWEDDPIAHPVGKTPAGKDICNRDFFGGNLAGVEEKLPYLASLGVETLYFCPIFEASENHRYGTADYHRIDPMLGTNEEFVRLCDRAHELGMRVLLDGVFNHTGWVSRYFNGDGFYTDSLGAVQSQDSPYRSWFQFRRWPEDYNAWWGIYSLPAVEEQDPDYRRFIYDSEDSVVRRWLRMGADGWRLDVADELPDDFIRGLRDAVRKEKPDATVIGEVWEDGTTKIAYEVRRRHLLGGHLDSLMNYPFRTALLNYLLGGDARQFREEMETLRENYPPSAFYGAMNALGTHDTLRILTLLGVGDSRESWSKDQRGSYRMTEQERSRGLSLLRLGAAVLFAFPGAPTLYYGDEAGMEGFEDPFNRRTYPWGSEDTQLQRWFADLGNQRRGSRPLREGRLEWGTCKDGVLSFSRILPGEAAGIAVNRGQTAAIARLPWPCAAATDPEGNYAYMATNGILRLTVPPMSCLRVVSVPDSLAYLRRQFGPVPGGL